MKYRYSKFRPEDLDGLDLEELLSKLSDLLLSSGFDNPCGSPYDDEDGALDAGAARRDPGGAAERRAAVRRDARAAARQGLADADDAEERLEQLIQQIIEKLQHQGYLTGRRPGAEPGPRAIGRAAAGAARRRNFRFEITDKSLDFLGYRALRDLLGSIGKSSIGRHDTREMATGIEASGAPKQYEFGDTMNIDAERHDPERGHAARAEPACEPVAGACLRSRSTTKT